MKRSIKTSISIIIFLIMIFTSFQLGMFVHAEEVNSSSTVESSVSEVDTSNVDATTGDSNEIVDTRTLVIENRTAAIDSEDSFANAVQNGGEIIVDQEIILTKPISITKNVTLKGSGTIKLADNWSETVIAPIKIEKGASLTIDGITFDGSNVQLSYGEYDNFDIAILMDVKGTLVFNSGNIQNFTNVAAKDVSQHFYFNMGLIRVQDGKFIMNGGTIQNNSLKNGQYQGIVYLSNGAYFHMTNGIFTNNYVRDNQSYSGIVKVSENNAIGGQFVMDGGQITKNKSPGVMVGKISGKATDHKPTFVLNQGEISYNKNTESYHAGGVLISNGEFIMNGGRVSDNQGKYYGGGISLTADPAAVFTMNGGVIERNKSMYGGGIYLTTIRNTTWQCNVTLNGGKIQDNIATRQGGGIYLVRTQEIYLKNVAIYGNTAAKLGGGIWTCSTGDLKTYVTNGGSAFDNTANGAGDDLAFVKHDIGSDYTEFRLSERMIGGGKAIYYSDGAIEAKNGMLEGLDGSGDYFLGLPDEKVERFNSADPGEMIYDVSLSRHNYALKNVPSDSAKKAAQETAKLIITGNKADRGAGIGSNGNVIIGDRPEDGGVEYSLNVKKTWADDIKENDKQEIEVALLSGTHEMDHIILNNSNNWSASFTGLPAGEYSVKELNVPNTMEATYSKMTTDNATHTYYIEITNQYVPINPNNPNEPNNPNDSTVPNKQNTPNQPEALSNHQTNTSGAITNNSEAGPKTGDKTNISIFVTLVIISGSVIVLLVIKYKRIG